MPVFRLWYPLPINRVTQRMEENANTWYQENGLKGHTSWDWHAHWGEPIPFCSDGVVYSVINRNHPDPERYRAVCVLVDVGEYAYEVIYGHLNEIYAKPGDISRPGTILGTAGNTGPVYAGGVLVTKEQKLAGSRDGTHLHGPQIRKCRKVRSPDGYLIYDGFGPYRDKDGFYYEILDYENGLNGCIDPTPYWTGMYAKDAPKFISIYQTFVQGLTTFVQIITLRQARSTYQP